MITLFLRAGFFAVMLLMAGPILWAGGGNNLIKDGGFEEITVVEPVKEQYFDKLIKGGCRFGGSKDQVIVPANFSQSCGLQELEVVEGEAGKEVHSGKRAVRVKGSYYLNNAEQDSYRAREGDMYQIRFYAKGTGDVQVAFALYGDGKYNCIETGKKGTLKDNEWTLMEQTFILTGPGVGSIFPRLCAGGAVIDDLVIQKINLHEEQVGRKVKPQEFLKATCAFPVKTAPVIDGKLDDPGWKDAPLAGIFLSYGDQYTEAVPPTMFQILYDATNLYVGVTCMEPELELLDELPAPADTKEQFVGKHSVEIFLDPRQSKSLYYQFVASVKGHRYEGRKMDGEWNGEWTAKTDIGTDRWTVEALIPFKTLDTPTPATGTEKWGINVCRNRSFFHSTWSPVGGAFHNPAVFSELIFGSYREWYEKVFIEENRKARETIANKARQFGLPEIDGQLVSIEKYVGQVDQYVKANGFPKTWPEFLTLYYKAAFVIDYYANLNRTMNWVQLINKEIVR